MGQKDNIIIITEEIKKRNLIEQYNICYKKNTQLKEIKQQILQAKRVVVYDITRAEKNKKKLHINDHINKTGKHPLIQIKPLEFIDISCLYTKNKRGIITTGLGKRFNKEKNKNPYPSTYVSTIAILCKKINPEIKIEATLINCL